MSAGHSDDHVSRLRTILEAGGELRLAVSGTSMRPLLREGDYLVIRPFDSPPRVGEVVVYSRDGQLWAHRLLARSRDGSYLLTKGDARGRPDAPLSPRDLIGRAVAMERGGRVQELGGLVSRLAGLAINLTAPAAVLGRHLARKAGISITRSRRRIPVAGFSVELAAPPAILRALPAARGARRGKAKADFTLEMEIREAPTTGGRYGLTDVGQGRYTLASPAVLARIDMHGARCRAALLPTLETEGLIPLLRVISILLVTERGEGLALHASAAQIKGRACLFSGPGGAGKSTALTRIGQAGAKPIADDLTLLRKEDGLWKVWGPPIEHNLLRRGYAPVKGAEVAALLVPARGEGALDLQPLSPARWATLAAVFPPGAPLYEKLLDRLADLAESVPAYRAEYADTEGALDPLLDLLAGER
jgi:Peptidase S24-like